MFPELSVIVNFHDMTREAPRTLHSLGAAYQGVDAGRYEVIAVDNGSSRPLAPEAVRAHGPQFRHSTFAPEAPSPCAAINHHARTVGSEFVMVCIDGARILSPGIVGLALQALRLAPRPFVYTLGMHLGPKPQNESMLEGYDQAAEDRLLGSVDWAADGYRLFGVSSVALSSRRGFFSVLSESNCFAMRRADFIALGGLDERFVSPGGGLVNLDFFNTVHARADMQPVMLLGEATFHQFHGGIATNVAMQDHPWRRMRAEYAEIRRRPFASNWRPPLYFGCVDPAVHGALLG